MDRVTTSESDIVERVRNLLAGTYLTAVEAQKIRCAVGEAESRGKSRQTAADLAAEERLRAHYRRHYAKGGEPLRVIDWSAPYEAEAVAQGQDGPDPQYIVAPRFGGAEMRSTPVDRPEGAPDALEPLYAVQAEAAAMTPDEADPGAGVPHDAFAFDAAGRAVLTPADADDDDPEDTPLVQFDGDAQEGE